MIQLPPYLKEGDTIGITCPAGYMAREKVETCIATLRRWGYNVKTGSTVGGSSRTYFSGTDAERLHDFQQMLDDNSVKAVLCGRGGYGVSRIIDFADFRKFRKHPKWVIGFSDITVLHSHINSRCKVATLHAPMAAAFNDGGNKSRYVLSLRDALRGNKASYSSATHRLNRLGITKGRLTGGNLSLLAHLIGTPSDADTTGKILFIEDVGEYLYSADRMLLQLKRAGKLSRLNGLIVGGFSDMKDTERPFGKTIYEIVKDAVAEYNYPVCMNFPVSHTKRNYALKCGVEYLLDTGKKKVTLEEL
ncbi:MAG: LD-carboxypeptidase [Chitinophagaceae bacterium]|nr:LD-carboxypeptidase [Chitinophagaceae bacterium]MCW5925971.1 LD-carboxypeptidase [Chitinophagaceae bacterium]